MLHVQLLYQSADPVLYDRGRQFGCDLLDDGFFESFCQCEDQLEADVRHLVELALGVVHQSSGETTDPSEICVDDDVLVHCTRSDDHLVDDLGEGHEHILDSVRVV